MDYFEALTHTWELWTSTSGYDPCSADEWVFEHQDAPEEHKHFVAQFILTWQFVEEMERTNDDGDAVGRMMGRNV